MAAWRWRRHRRPGRPFAAFGVDPDKPVARFNEALALMKSCWTDAQIDFEGRFWTLHGASMEPKPVQKPHPPVWFGGNAPAGMRRAARHGDGFMGAGSQTTSSYAEQVAMVKDELAVQNRDPRRSASASVSTSTSRTTPRSPNGGCEALRQHYGGGDWSEHMLAGTAEECVAGIRAVADAGAELILLNPLVDDQRQLERLAGEVIPALV